MKKLFLPLLLFCVVQIAWAEEHVQEVQIEDPFIEIHTGPGRGYPVINVSEKGRWIEILKHRAQWYLVRTSRGKEGWVHGDQLQRTLTPKGEHVELTVLNREDFVSSRWMLGAAGGDFDGASAMSIFGSYGFTQNLAVELSTTQALGEFSESLVMNLNLRNQPFPEWKYSPYFSLGYGFVETQVHGTLIKSEEESNRMLHVGTGVFRHLTRQFVASVEYNSYVAFTSRNNNEEIEEWKIGFAVFY